MRIITLNKVGRPVYQGDSSYSDTDDVGEPGAGGSQNVIPTSPCAVNVEAIRCFYPRIEGRPGTRITFTDGGGFAVSETYEEVLAQVQTH